MKDEEIIIGEIGSIHTENSNSVLYVLKTIINRGVDIWDYKKPNGR